MTIESKSEPVVNAEMVDEAYRVGRVQEVMKALGEDIVYQALSDIKAGIKTRDEVHVQIAIQELLRKPLKGSGFNMPVALVATTLIQAYTDSINRNAWDRGIAEWQAKQGE